MAAAPSAITIYGGCRRERPCYHAKSKRPLCNSCYRRENIKRWKIGEWSKPIAVCSRCGAQGPSWYARTEHPMCNSCHVRSRPRSALAPGETMSCPRCGEVRQCWRTVADGMLCRTCVRSRYTRAWEAPVAACAECGQTRPCFFARSERPVCRPCRRRELHPPRFPPGRPCSTCGQKRKLCLRVGDLAECQGCNQKRLRSKITCVGCGRLRRPSLGDPRQCEHCVGEPIRHVCRECGAEEKNHTDGRCARCSLAEVLRRLRTDGDPSAIAQLEPYLRAQGDGPKPSTTLKWMGYSAGYETVVEFAIGARELSHEALDQLTRGKTTSFLRAALVTHGVLEPRPEQTTRFGHAARAAVRELTVGEDRAQIRAFSVWQVQHELARRERRGRVTGSSAGNSLRLVRARWSSARGLRLTVLRSHGYAKSTSTSGSRTDRAAP